MPSKRILQDIVPSERKPKKSIRSTLPIRKEVSPVEEYESDIKYEKEPEPEKDWDEEVPIIIKKRNTSSSNTNTQAKFINSQIKVKRNYSKIITFAIVFVCISIIALALSLLYTKAVVTITPTTIPINIDGNFVAKKDNVGGDTLNYQVVSINYDEFKTIPATDGPAVQTKSKGTITLYNNYSSTTLKVLAGTKITNSKGLIYKTTWTVVIPGKKTVLAKLIPGSVDVDIVADQAGAEYNSLLSDSSLDYNILAYKSSPKFQGYYGKLKKDILGGFSGKKKIISPEVETAAITDLQNTLKDKLMKNIALAVPEDLVQFKNAYSIEYQKINSTSTEDGTSRIGMRGTLYGVIFNAKSLIDYLAKKQIDESRLSVYKIEGLKSLNFTLVNTKDSPIKKGSPISFSLSGPLKITGTFSESELKTKLFGVKLDQLNSIIKEYPSIKNVSVILTPFWMRRFPNSADNIIIEYK